MLVWGDQVRLECPREKLGRLRDALRSLTGMPAGIERHAALVAALIEAGELAQGLADALFAELGATPARRAAPPRWLCSRGSPAPCVPPGQSGFARLDPPPEAELRALAAAPLADAVRTKRAEGFALYSLYPESYLEAAAAVSLPAGPPIRVIGIRSIGAPLAALVAVALGAPPPVTLRPVGELPDPRVAVAAELAAELLADAASARFAVVDEGPGLSGSSFGAVADFLEDRGVAPGRIHFFASHRGPLAPVRAPPPSALGASHAARGRPRRSADPFAPRRPEHRLESWVADLVGEPEAPLEEISGGRWRLLRYAREADWPASNLYLERRKFLLRAASGTWLLKFAGLGREGARKLERARALHAAGFAPEVTGYRHGFLVERWLGELPSLDRGFGDRDRLVAQVGRYLGFRARHFPAGGGAGRAAGAALGDGALQHSACARRGSGAPARPLGARARAPRAPGAPGRDRQPAARLGVAVGAGRAPAQDRRPRPPRRARFVGCQDVAWDVVGAGVELGLAPPERDRLCGVLEAETGRAVDPDLLALLAPCYLALQLGDRTLATEIVAEWPAEAGRLRAAAGRLRAAAQARTPGRQLELRVAPSHRSETVVGAQSPGTRLIGGDCAQKSLDISHRGGGGPLWVRAALSTRAPAQTETREVDTRLARHHRPANQHSSRRRDALPPVSEGGVRKTNDCMARSGCYCVHVTSGHGPSPLVILQDLYGSPQGAPSRQPLALVERMSSPRWVQQLCRSCHK